MNERDLGARLIPEELVAPAPLEKVNKARRNSFEAIHDFELEIEDTEFLVLVGPSGCGTSTALRMMASLEASSTVDQDGYLQRVDSPPWAGSIRVHRVDLGVARVLSRCRRASRRRG